MLKIAIICGGPSLERGISLNSARSLMDHLNGPSIEIVAIYVDHAKDFYLLSSYQLYSNTPSDFDFKLQQTAQKLDSDTLKELLESIDLVFPVIHGAFGEDGEIQGLLETLNIPYVGSDHACCLRMFSKHKAAEILRQHGYPTIPSILLTYEQTDALPAIISFFKEHALKRAIVKPAKGGSSIGVSSVTSPQQAFEASRQLFSNNIDDKALVECFCEGTEFTILVLENIEGAPVALIPTEIEINYEQNQIFDYRKKYLPTNQATYHTPPRFEVSVIEQIRGQAEEIFKLFGMRDFVRLDGWVLNDGTICFSDINPISGLEQNSFFFRQTAVLGLTHQQALYYIVKSACRRSGLTFPDESHCDKAERKPIYILFGNKNAERQVSLMSGTNVWLKLLGSDRHRPIPCLYDLNGNIWKLPYSYALNHTVEEIYQQCISSRESTLKSLACIESVCQTLQIDVPEMLIPEKFPLDTFLKDVKKENAFVFIAMHGGEGEDGTLQRHLEKYQISFNGSCSAASALCMDKYQTGQIIAQLKDPSISSLPKIDLDFADMQNYSNEDFNQKWLECCRLLADIQLIIKPKKDGCSAGVVLLRSAEDLKRFAAFISNHASFIPPHTFVSQKSRIELPACGTNYLLEPYIETDRIVIDKQTLLHIPKGGWLELTVGVLERAGSYQSFNPSISIAEGTVLSLEEKFQGGTGINLTPPPEEILSPKMTLQIKRMVEKTAEALGIKNYARIDLFFNRLTGKMVVIEANTLPALTPSTVLYHQALAENPPLTPKAFLEKLIDCQLNKISNE